jgi:hypothetical protein
MTLVLILTPIDSDATQPTTNKQTTPTVEHVDTNPSVPKMEDFNITREKRQQLRGLLINSQPLTPDETARQSRSNGSSLTDTERKTFHADLDEAVRWSTFLVHTDMALPGSVDFVSSMYNVDEEEYQRALAKAVETHESFKTTTLDNLEEHATSFIRENRKLHKLDNTALTQKISDSFSPDKFFAAFAFMGDYLNFEDSSSLGKWYAKGIYINMTRAMV